MTRYSRPVLPPPDQISEGGRCTMGTFNGPLQGINPLDLHRPLGFPAPRMFNAFRLKEWQAFQISNDQWFICLAVYNTKSVGIAIVMAYSKTDKRMYRYERKVPAWRLQVPSGSRVRLDYSQATPVLAVRLQERTVSGSRIRSCKHQIRPQWSSPTWKVSE